MVDNRLTKTNRTSDGQETESSPLPQPTTAGIAILHEAETPIGRVELRRRRSLALEQDVYEILLEGDLMMSSAVHVSEDALAERGLHELLGEDLRVLIGGLGLGFTGLRVLDSSRVRSVAIVEMLAPVIQWNRDGSIPWSEPLMHDSRVELMEADFFAYLAGPPTPETTFDLILVDIDDGPEHVWHGPHAQFYTQQGLQAAAEHLTPGGVMAFWFATRPSEEFLRLWGSVVRDARIEPVPFDDPCLHRPQEHFLVLGSRRETT